MNQIENLEVPPRRGLKWTSIEHKQLIEEFNSGISFEDIANIHQRTVVAIIARLTCFVLQNNNDNLSLEELCEKTKIPIHYLSRYKEQLDLSKLRSVNVIIDTEIGSSCRLLQNKVHEEIYLELYQQKIRNDLKNNKCYLQSLQNLYNEVHNLKEIKR
jgi:uncharacterized protein YnzC (UPF0291/DUF896 family)